MIIIFCKNSKYFEFDIRFEMFEALKLSSEVLESRVTKQF